MKVALQLTEALAVFLVIFYLYCRSPAFRPLRPDWPRPRGKIRLFLVFTGIAILGNYLGVPVVGGQAIVNARAVGATLAGLLGGPILGGLVGGFVHLALKHRPERLMTPWVALVTTFVGEAVHMAIVYVMSGPQAGEIVRAIAGPMVIANPVGAALFMMVVLERQRDQDRVAAMSSARALKVAERTLRLLARGIGRETAGELAAIIKEETGVGAVGVTDRERVLGWAGMGMDHHLPGNPIASPYTRQSIAENAVVG